MNIEKRLSLDGSPTLFNPHYQESYHSLKDGAIRETIQKHILPPLYCLDLFKRKKIRILDLCFGLGYNSFFTIQYYLLNGYGGELEIYSPEKDEALFAHLFEMEYPQEITFLDGENIQEILHSLLENKNYAKNRWKIQCYFGDALDYLENFDEGFFDVIYQDAFSPAKNPELWSKAYFAKLASLLSENGIITTYSQKREVKERVQDCGLFVYEISQTEIRNSRIFVKKALDLGKLNEKCNFLLTRK